MSNTFNVSIATRDGVLYEGGATSLVAPGELGYLGILKEHAPLVTTLVKGKLTIHTDNNKCVYINVLGEGFLEVLKNHVTITLDGAEFTHT
jgi:F-type H+-transporting ATPase subunit epsilon